MRLRQRGLIAFAIQASTISAGFLLAWLLHFDFALPHFRVLLAATPVLVVIRSGVMFCCGLTNSSWRHTGITDLNDLLQSTIIGSLIFFIVLRWFPAFVSFPYSIYVLEGILSFLLLASLRVSIRMMLQARESRNVPGSRKPVLIVGAGSAAAQLIEELKHTSYVAVGLVDDDPMRWKTRLRGVPIFGSIDKLPWLAYRMTVSEILIAIPSATGAQMLRITDRCSRSGVPFRAVPSLGDLVAGRVNISEFREVNLDDLLGREPVRLELEDVHKSLSGRVVMVTGAAGSIGSELCRQIAYYQPSKLICLDHAETPLFNLQAALAESKIEIVYSVTDFTDSERMQTVLLEHQVEVLFHAAAYKHVPMMEQNLHDGLKNNVFGLLQLLELADECGCMDFLLISSDKAVKPSSFMGCTKRLGEMIVGARQTSRMRCVSVRFGNVLGSQGSVVPLFREQIRTRRCITITHPEMTRYFMTIPEAVSLVLQAFTVGEHGNILVLDMGKPVRILDLARTLIRMSGLTEHEVRITYSGIRRGEKLSEELFYDSEIRLPTMLPKVMCAETILPSWPDLRRSLSELESAAHRLSADAIRARIKQIIPEYQWENPAAKLPLPSIERFQARPRVHEAVAGD